MGKTHKDDKHKANPKKPKKQKQKKLKNGIRTEENTDE